MLSRQRVVVNFWQSAVCSEHMCKCDAHYTDGGGCKRKEPSLVESHIPAATARRLPQQVVCCATAERRSSVGTH
eukprot:3199755-Amphidinium_carterae.1